MDRSECGFCGMPAPPAPLGSLTVEVLQIAKVRAVADLLRGGCFKTGEEAANALSDAISTAPPPPAEQASGELVADVAAARRERDEAREELEYAQLELAYLANEMVFNGNSIGWTASKADNYKAALLKAWDSMTKAGFPPDGNTPLHEAIATAFAALSQRPVVVRPVNEPPENAPAHSVRVVVYLPEHGWRMGWYTRFMADKGEWPWSADTFTGLTNKTITHWMPEPPAPQQPEKGEG